MASNTKLTKIRKQYLKELKADYPHVKFVDNGIDVVIAYYCEGHVMRFATAVKSKDELKFRRKVGQMVAMERVLPDFDNVYAILPADLFYDMLDGLSIIY